MSTLNTFIVSLMAAWTFARRWVMDHLHDVVFYAQVGGERGLDGLVASWRMWRASKGLSRVYGHIEREVEVHEEHMLLLRRELAQAQREYHRCRAGVHGLFVDKR